MVDVLSDEARRDPFPLYAAMREASPVVRVPPPFDAWLVLDYEGVKRVLSDPATFSSRARFHGMPPICGLIHVASRCSCLLANRHTGASLRRSAPLSPTTVACLTLAWRFSSI